MDTSHRCSTAIYTLLATMMLLAALACGLPTTTVVVTATSPPGEEQPAPPPTQPPSQEEQPGPTAPPEETEEAEETEETEEWQPPAENPVMVPGFSARYACVSEVWYEPIYMTGTFEEGCNEDFSVPITYWVMDDGTFVEQREGESLPEELPGLHSGDRVAMLGVLGVDTALLWVPDVNRSYLEAGYGVDYTSFKMNIEDQNFVPAGTETITVAGQTIEAAILKATFKVTEEESGTPGWEEKKTWEVTITGWYDPASGLALRVEWRRKLVECEAPNPDWQNLTCLPMTQGRDLVLVYELMETTATLGG